MGAGKIGDKRFEVYMRGQIALSGFVQRVHFLMSVERLQRIAKRTPIAVVKNQRGAAVCVDPLSDALHDSWGLRAEFDEVAVFRIFKAMLESAQRGWRAQAESEVIVFNTDLTFAPCIAFADHLADWERVEKFVGNQIEWKVIGQLICMIVPCRRCSSQRVRLLLA